MGAVKGLMALFTRRDLLIGGAVLALVAASCPRLMERMEANRGEAVQAEVRDWSSAQSPRRAAAIAANEAAVLEDLRKVIAGQAAYRAANHGFYDRRLDCLGFPSQCIPSYPPSAPTFLDARLASLRNDHGYRRSFTPGPDLPVVPAVASATSVAAYRYDAWPLMIGHDGVRAFAADASGRICFTRSGAPVSEGPAGQLDPSCLTLEPSDPKAPSDAATAATAPSPLALFVRYR